MKKLSLLVILLVSFSVIGYSQNSIFSENKIDDMTGKNIRRTNWLTLRMEANRTYYTRFCQVDSAIFFDLKVLIGSYVSVDENAEFIIKFSDNSTMILNNYKYIVAGLGQGAIRLTGSKALGINPKFFLTKDQLENLVRKDIIKVRLYLNDGYIETEIKSKKAELLKAHCAQLFIRVFPS